MRYETHTVRIGENVGPVDWAHELAKDMPAIWREAEKNPEDFVLAEDFISREIVCLCMYDGWPYWRPMPALLVSGPMGVEWKHFDSYGIRPGSIRRKASADTHPKDGDVKQAPLVSGAVPDRADAQTQPPSPRSAASVQQTAAKNHGD